MNHLLLTLGPGMVLIALANFAVYRFLRLGARDTAVVVALAALGVYVPMALLAWPGGDVFAMHLALYLFTCLAFGLLMGAREASTGGDGRVHWGPTAIVVFFIALVVVDSVFLTLAERGLPPLLARVLLPEPAVEARVSSVFPGVISHDFQEKESQYNAYLARQRDQQARGWTVRKGWLGQAVAGEPAVFQVAATTRDGAPLRGASVDGEFLRPSDSRLDVGFRMEEVDPGVYRAAVALSAPGMWGLVLRLRRDGELHELRASTTARAPTP